MRAALLAAVAVATMAGTAVPAAAQVVGPEAAPGCLPTQADPFPWDKPYSCDPFVHPGHGRPSGHYTASHRLDVTGVSTFVPADPANPEAGGYYVFTPTRGIRTF